MNKKKIAVLTFHRSLNYGAVLQAYGLVKAIEKLGCNCEILEYRNKKLERNDSIKRFLRINGLFRTLYQIFEMPFWFIRKYKFNAFLSLLGSSQKIFKIDSYIEKEYDKFFVGSDQVWNYKITGGDPAFFFNGISDMTKINSYAASFGLNSIPNELCSKYKQGLIRFSKISVREPQGATIVKNLTGIDAKLVIDPSLLLAKDEWLSLIGSKKYIDGDYILIYQRAFSKSLIKFAQDLSLKKCCSIVTINGNPRQLIKAKYILDAGPIDFLNIIANARYVVTNSYHGIAFSLNLNKDFFIELLDEKFEVNSRLIHLLNYYNITNRVISQCSGQDDITPVDFGYINQKITEARSSSFDFLKNAILE